MLREGLLANSSIPYRRSGSDIWFDGFIRESLSPEGDKMSVHREWGDLPNGLLFFQIERAGVCYGSE